MKVYSYSEARQQLAQLLNRVRQDGQVEIRRRDGQAFIVRPAESAGSPLDVPGVDTDFSREEIVRLVRESRRSTERFVKGLTPPNKLVRSPSRSGRPNRRVRSLRAARS